MTTFTVVVRYGTAYSDAELDQLQNDIENTGVSAALEPTGPRAGVMDVTHQILLELSQGAAAALLSEAMKSLWTALLIAADRRRRAEPDDASDPGRPEPTAIMELPDRVHIIVPADLDAVGQVDVLMQAVDAARTAGTLTPGVWRWNPVELRLEPHDTLPGRPTV